MAWCLEYTEGVEEDGRHSRWEWSLDGTTWHACTSQRFGVMLETYTLYPDAARKECDSGAVILGPRSGGRYFRRRRTAAELELLAKQGRLF